MIFKFSTIFIVEIENIEDSEDNQKYFQPPPLIPQVRTPGAHWLVFEQNCNLNSWKFLLQNGVNV